MTNKILLLGLALSLAGCATTGGMQSVSCNQAVCLVKVTVSGSCSVSATPYSITVGSGNQEIHLDLDGGTYATDGIFFKGPTGGSLSAPQRVSDTKYLVKNLHGAHGDHEYGIRVVQGTMQCPDYDPWIIN